ncbi:hypothetical protein EJ08DRAFT_46975 [Tothia fuscella]|uniref:Ankyrin repeat protein n=1 Tax=Tothia fuscella TaxID=1048955 RepID=A0A9P4NF97_9PEZI|nr:hypothetical protein EJ08DRAFT_46975 [Tothia fuscella]
MAVQYCHADVVKAIVATMAQSANGDLERDVLDAARLAAMKGCITILEVLFDHFGLRFRYMNSHVESPLVCAAKGGQAEAVRFLLKPEYKLKESKDFDTIAYQALRLAAGRGYISVIKALIGSGISVNKQSSQTMVGDAMLNAIVAGRTEVIKLLMEHGATMVAPMTTHLAADFRNKKYPLKETVANTDADRFSCPYPGPIINL